MWFLTKANDAGETVVDIGFSAGDEDYWETELFDAVSTHAKCQKCSQSLTECPCGVDGGFRHLVCSERVFDEIVEPAWKIDRRRREYDYRRRLKRQERLKTAGKPPPRSAILELLAIQQSRCYYCGIGIDHGYHRDHVTPLFDGGTNALTNTVLACGPCNRKKGRKHISHLWKHLRQVLEPSAYAEIQVRARNIRTLRNRLAKRLNE
ncbi:HNH endonuclease [Hyphobacterium sp.]|uniref:HNH endonuclease n=1 Tax=Hyphobacterium sp. TaxID=2004662 RepID=UPI00374893E3